MAQAHCLPKDLERYYWRKMKYRKNLVDPAQFLKFLVARISYIDSVNDNVLSTLSYRLCLAYTMAKIEDFTSAKNELDLILGIMDKNYPGLLGTLDANSESRVLPRGMAINSTQVQLAVDSFSFRNSLRNGSMHAKTYMNEKERLGRSYIDEHWVEV